MSTLAEMARFEKRASLPSIPGTKVVAPTPCTPCAPPAPSSCDEPEPPSDGGIDDIVGAGERGALFLSAVDDLLNRHEKRLQQQLDHWAFQQEQRLQKLLPLTATTQGTALSQLDAECQSIRLNDAASKYNGGGNSPTAQGRKLGESGQQDNPQMVHVPSGSPRRVPSKTVDASEGSTTSVAARRRVLFHAQSVTAEDLMRKEAATRIAVCDSDTSTPSSGGKGIRRTVQQIVSSSVFEGCLAAAIMVSAVFIGVEVEHDAQNPDQRPPFLFFVIGSTFTALFTTELSLRIFADGTHFFWTPSWAWNYLDVFIVLTSLFETAVDALVVAGDVQAQGTNLSNLRIIRVLRITRCIRTLRVTRIIRCIAALRTLVASILATLKSLIWAMCLLVMIIYAFGVVCTQSSVDYFQIHGVDEVMREYYGSLPTAMYTLFKCVTGGLNWHDVVVPLDRIGIAAVVLFTVFIFFTYFAVLNVVTGVFCQSAIETVEKDPDLASQSMLASRKKYVATLRNLFRKVDGNSSGQIDLKELENLLSNEQTQAYLAALGLDTDDAWAIFKLVDTDGNNKIDVEEFVEGVMRLRGHARGLDLQAFMADHRLLVKRLTSFMRDVDDRFRTVLAHHTQRTSSKPARGLGGDASQQG